MFKEIYNPELGEELYVRIEPNNCFYKFVVFAGKERNFDGYLKKGSSKKFTKGITSKWNLLVLCRWAMLLFVITWTAMQFEGWKRVASPQQLKFKKKKEQMRSFKTRTAQNKWIIINAFLVNYKEFSPMLTSKSVRTTKKFELWTLFHKSL